MKIFVNGESFEANGAANVAQLVQQLQLPPSAVLIEHNGVALHQREWPEKKIAEGDRVEFLRVVAGG